MNWYIGVDTTFRLPTYGPCKQIQYFEPESKTLQDAIHDWLTVLDWQMRNGEKP